MARIAGIDLPREKRIEIGLTYIYGIGLASSQKILANAEVNPDIRVKDLTDDQVQAIRKAIIRVFRGVCRPEGRMVDALADSTDEGRLRMR